jgi:hypothetical protein
MVEVRVVNRSKSVEIKNRIIDLVRKLSDEVEDEFAWDEISECEHTINCECGRLIKTQGRRRVQCEFKLDESKIPYLREIRDVLKELDNA